MSLDDLRNALEYEEANVKMETKVVMILGASASEVPVIERAIEMEYCTVVVDQEEDAPGFLVDGVTKVQNSIADKETILKLAEKYKVDGILASVDAGVYTAAYVAQAMNLPGISMKAAFMGTNKVAMRKRLRERNIPVPRFYIVEEKKEYLDTITKFNSKCVVKAADSSGSRGIYLLNDVNAIKDVNFAYDYCKRFSGTGELLLEEFMDGPEVCVETLSSGGICYPIQITDQMPKKPPYFTDCGYSQPSILDKETQEKIKQIAIDANIALENYQGSSCTEMIVTKEGPKVVEMGARLAGDFMATRMVPLSTGVDMPGAVIKIALGESIDIMPMFKKASCVRYFMKERVGKIKEIKGIKEACAVSGVTNVGALKKVGDEAMPLRKSSDRLGYVITQCDTVGEAIKSAEEALKKMDFLVEE